MAIVTFLGLFNGRWDTAGCHSCKRTGAEAEPAPSIRARILLLATSELHHLHHLPGLKTSMFAAPL